MIILYISHLDGSIANGLSWSVPASVKAQSKIDTVLWVNTSNKELPHWKQTQVFFKCGHLRTLNRLQPPFNKPDIVVFEGFYDDINDVFLGQWLKKNSVPYIIVPRSALTIHAFNNHSKLKKRIAHYFFYNSFIENALAIQFLTKKEQEETIKIFKKTSFVIPNGISQPAVTKVYESLSAIKAIFIGRIDIYQKGLDLLLESISLNRKLLKACNFTLDIYGPLNQDYFTVKRIIDKLGVSDIVVLKGEIKGVEKETALLSADVFFLTSRFEGHPMGLIEALSYGLPCFITSGTNMADIVEQFGCGWVCDFTIDSISKKLKQMINSTESFKDVGIKSIELSKIYDWKILAEKFHNRIKGLLK